MNRLHVTRTSHHTTSHRTIHCRPQYKDTLFNSVQSKTSWQQLFTASQQRQRSDTLLSTDYGTNAIEGSVGRCGEGRWKAHCRFWWDWLIICLVCSFLDSIFTYTLLLTLISWYFHHCIPKNIRSGDTSRHITISITQRPDNARLALPQRYCRIRRRGINLHISIRHFHQGILLSDVTIMIQHKLLKRME